MGGDVAIEQLDIRTHIKMKEKDALTIQEIKDERLSPGRYLIDGWYGAVGIAPLDNEDLKNQDCNWIVSITKSEMFDERHKFSKEHLPLPNSKNTLLYREEIWMDSLAYTNTRVAVTQSQGLPWGMFPHPIEVSFDKLFICLTTNAFHVPNDASVCILMRKI